MRTRIKACQVALDDALTALEKLDKDLVEIAEAETRKELRSEAKVAADPERGEVTDRAGLGSQVAEVQSTDLPLKPEIKPIIVEKIDLNLKEEIANWRSEDKSKKEISERKRALKKYEDKIREEKVISEGKIKYDARQKEAKKAEERRNIISEATAKRGTDALFKIADSISDSRYFDVIDACKITPDLALTILSKLDYERPNFRNNAQLEIERVFNIFPQKDVASFMSTYVIDTLEGGDAGREKLTSLIQGDKFSAACALHVITKFEVQKLNARMDKALARNKESIPHLVVDYSEPYYGPLCADLSLLMRAIYLKERDYDNWIAMRMKTYKELERNIHDFLGYTKSAMSKNDKKIARLVNSNQWNEYCVLAGSKT